MKKSNKGSKSKTIEKPPKPENLFNPNADGLDYFIRNCTFDQIMIVREACVGLKELGVFTLPKAAFHEGKKLGNCFWILLYACTSLIRDSVEPGNG